MFGIAVDFMFAMFRYEHPHQRQVAAPNDRVATAKIRTVSHDGGVLIYHHLLHQRQVSAPNDRAATATIRIQCVMNTRYSHKYFWSRLPCSFFFYEDTFYYFIISSSSCRIA